jgi:GT2 family glycosyltransferase
MTKSISVVIPNYNGTKLLETNIPSVYTALENTGLPFEILVIDDASPESPKAMLEEKFPDVRLVVNDKNLGFGGNVNKGVALTLHQLVLILNSDISLTPDYFKSQLSFFDKEDTFAVGGKIIDTYTGNIEGAWYPFIKKNKLRWKPYILKDDQDVAYTFYVCGGNALVDKKKFIKLGGFSAIFHPFYMEDVELSIKAWRSGYKCYYSNDAECYHQKSSTIENHFKQDEITIASRKNFHLIHFIHSNTSMFIIWLLKFRFYQIKNVLGLLKGNVKDSFIQLSGQKGEALSVRTQNTFPLSLKQVITFIQQNL